GGVKAPAKGRGEAAGGGPPAGSGAVMAAGPRPVLDDELLTEPLRQPLSHQAPEDIALAARRDWHDQTHRPRRIGLRPSDARYSRQRSSTRGQMQKLSAGGVYCLPLFQVGEPRGYFPLCLA